MRTDADNHTAGWTWEQALTGIVPPLISPLARSGTPDAVAQARVVEHVLGNGCSGLFVLGGTGEGAWLTTSQRGLVVRGAVRAAAGRVPVLVGVTLPASGPAAEAALQAEGEGADAVVVGSPYYGQVDPAGQERHVEAILHAVSLPALLYNIPQATHNPILPATARRMAGDPRVLGIKDSAGDLGAFQEFVAIKRVHPFFRVLQGNEHCASSSLLLGADGLVPGMANFAPALFVALRAAAAARDVDACARLQEEISDLWAIHRQGHVLTALKAACAMFGLGNGIPSAPLRPATRQHRRAIAAIIERHEIGLPA